MSWFLGIIIVLVLVVAVVNGLMDFISKMPNSPLGVFFIIVGVIPAWIVLKTIFMRPSDKEIDHDWNFYAAFVVISIIAFLVGAIFIVLKFLVS